MEEIRLNHREIERLRTALTAAKMIDEDQKKRIEQQEEALAEASLRCQELEREKRECEQMSEDIGAHPHGNCHIITTDQLASGEVVLLTQGQIRAAVEDADQWPRKFGWSSAMWGLLKKLNITVISIKRKTSKIDDMGNPVREESILQPSPSTVLRDEDVLVIIGKDEDINSLKEY